MMKKTINKRSKWKSHFHFEKVTFYEKVRSLQKLSPDNLSQKYLQKLNLIYQNLKMFCQYLKFQYQHCFTKSIRVRGPHEGQPSQRPHLAGCWEKEYIRQSYPCIHRVWCESTTLGPTASELTAEQSFVKLENEMCPPPQTWKKKKSQRF